MLGLSANLQYFLCCTPVDMRNGFDGLAGIVRNILKQNPVGGSVFIFINRAGTHIKLLYWDGDGFALFYKRLERGRYSMGEQSRTSSFQTDYQGRINDASGRSLVQGYETKKKV